MPGKVKEYAIDQLKRHGLPFVMMAIAIWFFYNDVGDLKIKVDNLHTEVKECNDQLIELYSQDHVEMREVIIKNTEVFKRIVN